ncbi:MAG TPA: hypothetical protein VHY35_08155 [Stellaceae bacterium]|jgi:hypothetical protein|nr:hypothetical protein [Stellaceae bacterium]
MPDTTDRDSEFAAAVQRAGLTIPAERWEAMRDAYVRMHTLLAVLDDALTYADEPAVLPDLVPRSGA